MRRGLFLVAAVAAILFVVWSQYFRPMPSSKMEFERLKDESSAIQIDGISFAILQFAQESVASLLKQSSAGTVAVDLSVLRDIVARSKAPPQQDFMVNNAFGQAHCVAFRRVENSLTFLVITTGGEILTDERSKQVASRIRKMDEFAAGVKTGSAGSYISSTNPKVFTAADAKPPFDLTHFGNVCPVAPGHFGTTISIDIKFEEATQSRKGT